MRVCTCERVPMCMCVQHQPHHRKQLHPAQLHPSHPDWPIYNKNKPGDTCTSPAPKPPTCSPGDVDTNPGITQNHPKAPQHPHIPAWGGPVSAQLPAEQSPCLFLGSLLPGDHLQFS